MRQLHQLGVDLIKGDTWPKRRRVVYCFVAFCGLVVAYCLGAATAIHDVQLIREAHDAAWFYGFGFGFAFTYALGSLVDDFDKRRHLQKPAPEKEPVE